MRIRRIAGVAALVAAACTALAVPGAEAQTDLDYGAASEGKALDLSLLGQGLTIGAAQSSIGSAPEASANGAGLANPLSPVGITEASVDADGESVDTGQNCEGELPDDIPILTLGLACSSSEASIANGFPSSTATAGVVEPLEVDPISPLLDTPLSEALAPTQEVLDQVLEELCVVLCEVDQTLDLELQDTLQDLVDSLFGGVPLVSLTVGTTEVSSEATTDTITTACTANGATISILDPPAAGATDLPPLLEITVGEAGTEVSVDTDTADATANVTPALVTIEGSFLPDPVTVEVGETFELPLPDPLTSRIVVADGETGTTEDGQGFATANSILIELFTGLEGGVRLSLAECASVAGAEIPTPATTAPPSSTTTTTEPGLPKTGGSSPNGWALGASVGLAGLGLILLRRGRTTV